LPAIGTISRVLKRQGLIESRKRPRHSVLLLPSGVVDGSSAEVGRAV
jgi:hypothetical protein